MLPEKRAASGALAAALICALAAARAAQPMPGRELFAREDRGYLERAGPQLVPQLKGSPEEIGGRRTPHTAGSICPGAAAARGTDGEEA